jgi:predicted kinase
MHTWKKLSAVGAFIIGGVVLAACTSAQDQANNNDVQSSAQALNRLRYRTRKGKWFVVDSCAGHVDDEQLVEVKRLAPA